MKFLERKKILLIISGGIAAYKSLDLIRYLTKLHCEVKTILTKGGAEFVTPLSIASLSKNKVYSDIYSAENETEMDHISLCLLYTSPSPRDVSSSRMPSSA